MCPVTTIHTSEFAAALAIQKLVHQEPTSAAAGNILNKNTSIIIQSTSCKSVSNCQAQQQVDCHKLFQSIRMQMLTATAYKSSANARMAGLDTIQQEQEIFCECRLLTIL